MAILGVDIGGTKTRAVAVDAAGRRLADVSVSTASIQSVGVDGAAAALGDLVAELAGVADQVSVVAVGSAGVDTAELQERLHALVSERFPHAAVRVVHDTRLLLAAGQVEAGCVLIVGTGSAAWAINVDGVDARVGGWGWLLGDEGSAFGVVKASVQAALRDRDRGREPTRLTRELIAAVGVSTPMDLIGAFHATPGSQHWGGFADAVMAAVRAGCPQARAVLDGCLDAAAGEVELACARVGITGPVVLAGGFVQNVSEVASGLQNRLESLGLHDISVLRRDPVMGAVDLAEALAAEVGHSAAPSPEETADA